MRTPRLEPPRVTVQGTGRPTVTNRLLIQEARTLPWHTHTHTCGEEGHGSNGAAPPREPRRVAACLMSHNAGAYPSHSQATLATVVGGLATPPHRIAGLPVRPRRIRGTLGTVLRIATYGWLLE